MRSTRNQPFCWQEKKILRFLRTLYKGSELLKMRGLYTAITEIDNDFNGRDIRFYTKTISTYSGLSKEWIPKGLKAMEELRIIEIYGERENGKFKGKSIKFTPENIQEIPLKTVSGKPINGDYLPGFLEPSEDIPCKEDNQDKNNEKKPKKPQNQFNWILDHWNSFENLTTHKEKSFTRNLTYKLKIKINQCEPQEIKNSISNYAGILASKNHRWSYQWTLWDFLDRGLDRFLDESKPWEREKISGQERASPPDDEKKQKLKQKLAGLDEN